MARYGEQTALVVVDMQNDFADPAGALAVTGAGAVLPVVNEAVADAVHDGAFVIATQDWHPPSTPHFVTDGGTWPVHCVAESWGAELHPGLRLPPDTLRVRKGANGEDGYSGFTMRDPETGEETPTELEALLRDRDIDDVVVVGLATDYCVSATALDALRLGFDVTVLSRAVAAVNVAPGDGDRALSEMADTGVEIA